jgi:hypothetical protein
LPATETPGKITPWVNAPINKLEIINTKKIPININHTLFLTEGFCPVFDNFGGRLKK